MSRKPLIAFVIGCLVGFGVSLLRGPAAPDSTTAQTALPSAPASSPDEIRDRLRAILDDDDPMSRIHGMSALLPSLDASAIPTVLEVVEGSALDGGDPEVILFAMWWARHQPQAAFDWAGTDWRGQFGGVIAAVFRSWGTTDPQAALIAAQKVPFSGQRDIATDAATVGWDESGQPGLLEFIGKLHDADQQRLSGVFARRRVAQLGPEGAMRWAQSLDDETLRHKMELRVAEAAIVVKGASELVTEWAAPRIARGEMGVPRRIGTRWARHDPKSALAWFETLPRGAERDDGLTETYRTWLFRDRAGAMAWMRETGIQRWNEPAAAIYLGALAGEDPIRAMDLAMTIEDPALRESTVIIVGRMWTEADPEAAQAWLAKSSLSENTRRLAAMPGHNPVRERARERKKAEDDARADVRAAAGAGN